jgi:hypothetical protein
MKSAKDRLRCNDAEVLNRLAALMPRQVRLVQLFLQISDQGGRLREAIGFSRRLSIAVLRRRVFIATRFTAAPACHRRAALGDPIALGALPASVECRISNGRGSVSRYASDFCYPFSRMTRLLHCELSIWPMSARGQKHALPCRSIAVRFTPTSRPRRDGLNATLCAKTRTRALQQTQSQSVTRSPRRRWRASWAGL